jgi:hypothetical protein
MGDVNRANQLRDSLDKRALDLFDRIVLDGVNPITAPLDHLASFAPELGVVIDVLRSAPRASMKALTDAVATECAVTAASASRNTYRAISILTACERAERNDAIVELK